MRGESIGSLRAAMALSHLWMPSSCLSHTKSSACWWRNEWGPEGNSHKTIMMPLLCPTERLSWCLSWQDNLCIWEGPRTPYPSRYSTTSGGAGKEGKTPWKQDVSDTERLIIFNPLFKNNPKTPTRSENWAGARDTSGAQPWSPNECSCICSRPSNSFCRQTEGNFSETWKTALQALYFSLSYKKKSKPLTAPWRPSELWSFHSHCSPSSPLRATLQGHLTT